MDDALNKLDIRCRHVDLVDLASTIDQVPSITQAVAASLPSYKGSKQVQQFFQSGLVRPLKVGVCVVGGTSHYVFYMSVFPRSSGSAAHHVVVVWDGAKIVDFACDCAQG